ncbi:GIP [Symbiodinium necroappetens]|uniref:GIP protein n=1 Tax=Symbiodinium necroappetens TaxID=1628268 RepID=A0A813C256_9DINO|nr:GIP [Symbiodinium necroappetens]
MAHLHGPPLAQPPVLAKVAECRAPGWVDSKITASRQCQREQQHRHSHRAKWTGALLSTSLALHSRRRCFQDRSRKRQPFRACMAAAQYGDEFVGDTVDIELADSLRQRTLESLDLDFVLEKLQALCYTAMAADMAINPEALMADSAEEARALYATVLELTQLEDADLDLEEKLDILGEVEECTRGAVLEMPSLCKISRSIEALLRLRNGLEAASVRGVHIPSLMALCQEIELPDKLLDAILEVFALATNFFCEMSMEAFDEEQELSLKKFPELIFCTPRRKSRCSLIRVLVLHSISWHRSLIVQRLPMPMVPTFDMAAADPPDFGMEEELPELEPEEGATADPGPTLPPGLGELLRCVDCDGNDFLPDYLGRPRCRTCGSFVQYRVDRPDHGPATMMQVDFRRPRAGDDGTDDHEANPRLLLGELGATTLGQVKTAALDQDLPDENLEHPQHLSLGDMRAASSPRKKDSSGTPSWNSRMGPEKNVRWRGGTPPSPPTWRYDVTDLRAFSKWSRKVQIWEMQIKTYMTPREASLLLYNSLSGEAEAELEHAPLEKINSDSGIQYILESLKAPMEQKAVFQKRKFLSDFGQLSRYPGEGLRTYANRYRRVERSLEALGVSITGMYDSEARGNRLLERARLTQADQRLILVGARYSLDFDNVAESMVMQYPEFKAAPPVVNKDGTLVSKPFLPRDKGGKGGGRAHGADPRKQPDFVDDGGPDDPDAADPEQPEPDANDDHDDEADYPDLSEVAEVLTGSPGKGPPQQQSRKPAHQTFFMRDAGTYEATDVPEYGALFQANVVFKVQAKPEMCAAFSRVMVLDTACQRTCCGVDWERSHDRQLKKHGLSSHQVSCTDSFQFGSGDPLKAAGRTYLPVGLGGTNLIFGVGVVTAKLPLLGSNKLLDQLGMILDLPRNRVCFEKLSVTVPLLRIGGHLTVCITDFSNHVTWQQLQETVNWESAPAELVAQDVAETGPKSTPPSHGSCDLPRAAPTWMASLLAAPHGQPSSLPEAGLHELGGGGEPRHPPGHGVRDDSAGAGRGLQPPPEHLRASRVRPLRQLVREVRPMQEVPPETPMERAPRSMGRSPKGGLRYNTTFFAMLCQYLIGGGAVEQHSVPAYIPDFPHRGHGEGFPEEAVGTPSFGEQRLRDGRRPLEAAQRRGLGDLRLDRGRVKRLKGTWAKSAKVLESEKGIYEAAPSTTTRPPPTVDYLAVFPDHYHIRDGLASRRISSSSTFSAGVADRLRDDPEGWRGAPRALRRLRPHVLCLSYRDFSPDGTLGNNMHHLLAEQVDHGRAFIVMTRPGSGLGAHYQQLADHSFATTRLARDTPVHVYTNIPGAAATLASTDHQDYQTELLEPLLGTITDYVVGKEPLRFGIYEAFVRYRTPVTEQTAWNEMADMLHRSFGTSSSRPFYVDPAGDVGQKISDLFRLRLARIQCVQTPTQRRMPTDVPFTRAAFLMYADGSRTVEAVRYAILAYGDLIEDQAEAPEQQSPEVPVAGLPTDITFPGLAPTVPLEVRRAIARAHVNLGHATHEELLRLAVQIGTPSDLFLQAIRRLKCATCDRLRGPQKPPPATATTRATQFGDRVEADVFYCRDLRGRSVIVLGVVDAATRLHQAAILSSRDPEVAYEALERVWLRPFGLMVELAVDPDGAFQGAFEERLRSHGVLVNYCAADAHWQIGQVERQNAFLRTVIERLVDTFAATDVTEMQLLLAPALHAVNSMVLTRGRSAYQAVFGRVPRLSGGLFSDSHALATTPTTDAAASAEIVRAEATKTIADLNVKQSLRRAILRKTRNVRVADLQPGQPCAYWRWRKRCIKKRGGWVTAKFLSWDPSSPGKLAWVRSGTSTAMVAIEQLRVATGFEAWVPTEEEVQMLKDAAKNLDSSVWADETGPPPPKRQLDEDEVDLDTELFDGATPELAAATAAIPQTPPTGPSSSSHFDPEDTTRDRSRSLDFRNNKRYHREQQALPPGPSEPPVPVPPTPLEIGNLHHYVPGSTFDEGYGPKTETYYEAYLSSAHRKDDLKRSNKDPAETDSSDSDWDDSAPGKHNKKPLTRAEAKALDREIPWRKILDMNEKDIEAFKAATVKEAKSWEEWGSVKPLSHAEAERVLKDKILSKRILRTRSCFRDKSQGLAELVPKCRVVALGHKDPDIFRLNRECATPNRTSEHILFCVMVAGHNKEFDDSGLSWTAWSGDASTAFLQGDIKDSERDQPLYLLPPTDGITAMTDCWKARLYLVCTNIYGLSNAPRLWALTVIARLKEIGYRQHAFDKMVFLKNREGQLDYDNTEVTQAFRWGVLQEFALNKTVTFKGKQLTLKEKPGVHRGHVPRKDSTWERPLDQLLNDDQKAEFRSIAGCLQWISGQTRPELAAVNSLANHGSKTTLADLRDLYQAVDFARETKEDGFIIPDVPLNKATVVLAYSDASWANAEQSRSQCGVLIVLCSTAVLQRTVPAMIVDWKSCRSQRVCRSTLAAESCAADEACDRSSYVNMFLGELLYEVPAHRVGQRLHNLAATDAKSLYDVVVSDSPNLSDKRSLVNIRAIQEVVAAERFHWVPATLMWADSLTKQSLELQLSMHDWLQNPSATLKQ